MNRIADQSIYLDDLWNVHFHDPGDRDWTMKSYHLLHTLSAVEDFWTMNFAIRDKLVDGMFFIMREHIFPCWDDVENKDGGCFSIKVPKANALRFWESLSSAVLGETLFRDSSSSKLVNGISVSPKSSFCIFKIWVAEEGSKLKIDDMIAMPLGYVGGIMYKSWKFTE